MKLSVIVPIYNAEKTLRKCIESIVHQEYPDIEILLIDDGSTDSSPAICDEYAKANSRIVVHHKKNGGLVMARKVGAALATGDYIGFVDSDDYIDANMYSSLMSEVERTGADIVAGGILVDYPEHSRKVLHRLPVGYYDKDAIQTKILPNILMRAGFYQFGIIPGVCLKVFKKSLIQEGLSRVDDALTLGEDVAITSYCTINADSFSVMETTGYHYIQTDVSMTRKYNPKRFDSLCQVYRCIEKIEMPAYKEQTGAYFACLLWGILAEVARNLPHRERRKKIKELLNHETTISALQTADVTMWAISERIKFFLMKHKMMSLLISALKR